MERPDLTYVISEFQNSLDVKLALLNDAALVGTGGASEMDVGVARRSSR